MKFISPHRYGFNGKEKDDEVKGEGNSYDFGARIYDPRLGRWLACDPLASKYPFLSSYNFVSNNPIIAIDPDGKKIVIVSDDPEFRSKTFTQLQMLTSTQLVLLKNGQVVEANKVADFPESFIEMKGTPTETAKVSITVSPSYFFKVDETVIPKDDGTALVSEAINDLNTLKIVPLDASHTGNETAPTSSIKARGLKPGGSGSTIYFDPDGKGENIVNEDGTCGRPPQIGLGHEIGHGVSAMKGQVDLTTPPNIIDPDSKQAGVLSNEEIKNRKLDSKIRVEQGVTERATPTEGNP